MAAEHRRQAWIGYHIALLQRVKREAFPKTFDEFYDGRPKVLETDEEIQGFFAAIRANAQVEQGQRETRSGE